MKIHFNENKTFYFQNSPDSYLTKTYRTTLTHSPGTKLHRADSFHSSHFAFSYAKLFLPGIAIEQKLLPLPPMKTLNSQCSQILVTTRRSRLLRFAPEEKNT